MKEFLVRFALFILLFLIGMEILFRTGLPASEYPRGVQDETSMVGGFDATWMAEGTRTIGRLCHRQGRWNLNDAGWNSIFEYGPRTEAERPRIAVVGNSYIAGWAADVNEHLDVRLFELAGGRADVFAFGKPGITFAQYIGLVRYIEAAFDPDIYLIFLANRSIQNSRGRATPYQFCVRERGAGLVLEPPAAIYHQNPYGRILFRSALARYLKFNRQYRAGRMNIEVEEIAEAGAGSLAPLEEADIELADFLLKTMVKEIPQDRIVLFSDANREAIYSLEENAPPMIDYRLFEGVVSRYPECTLLDLTAAMREDYETSHRRFESEYDVHWNAYGHRVAAESLFDVISGWLEPGSEPLAK